MLELFIKSEKFHGRQARTVTCPSPECHRRGDPSTAFLCLCLRSKFLHPRIGTCVAQLGLGISQQGHVAQKWLVVNISREDDIVTGRQLSLDMAAPYPRCCPASSLSLWCSICVVPSASQMLLGTACSLPPLRMPLLTIWSEFQHSPAVSPLPVPLCSTPLCVIYLVFYICLVFVPACAIRPVWCHVLKGWQVVGWTEDWIRWRWPIIYLLCPKVLKGFKWTAVC